MKNKIFLVFMAMILVFAMAVSAQAAFLVDLIVEADSGVAPNLGQINVGGGFVTGTKIPVEESIGFGTPLNAGVIHIFPVAEKPILEFSIPIRGGGGSITVTDAVGNILTGNTFSDVTVTPAGGGSPIVQLSANFKDIKELSTLSTFYGYDPGISALGTIAIAWNRDTHQSLSGAISNYAPIPGSLVLLGSGILGLAGIGIRRKSA